MGQPSSPAWSSCLPEIRFDAPRITALQSSHSAASRCSPARRSLLTKCSAHSRADSSTQIARPSAGKKSSTSNPNTQALALSEEVDFGILAGSIFQTSELPQRERAS